jgi:hypothetical protein
MIYFLINNDYHLDLDLKLAKQLKNRELGLIQVPYSLTVIKESPFFSRILCFNYKLFISIKRLVIKPFEYCRIRKELMRNLKVNSEDILLVHTEIELFNHLIIQLFYENNARVFLIEDGTATISDNNLPLQKGRIVDKVKTFFLRLNRLKYSSILNFGHQTLPRMKDHLFKGIIVNFGESINRNIPLYHLRKEIENIEISFSKGAIFFSQPLYMWFLTEEDYIYYINEVLTISNRFSPFFFKFHPSESRFVIDRITELINKNYSGIHIIEEKIIAEMIIYKYPVNYAITFNSTASLNLINKGIIPIYLNNIFTEKFPSNDGYSFSNFLLSIKCNSPKDLNEVKPGFIAFDRIENEKRTYSISEILTF